MREEISAEGMDNLTETQLAEIGRSDIALSGSSEANRMVEIDRDSKRITADLIWYSPTNVTEESRKNWEEKIASLKDLVESFQSANPGWQVEITEDRR